jgi:hypothetical protein
LDITAFAFAADKNEKEEQKFIGDIYEKYGVENIIK